MSIKWMYEEIKYNVRKFIIRLVKPTRFEWAVWSPFGDFDGMEIRIRYGFNKSKDLELRFGKSGAHFFCGYYSNTRKVKRRYVGDFFLNNEIKDEFYPVLKEINPEYITIKVESQYKSQKKVMAFINHVKKMFPKKKIKIKAYDELWMFN